jgi:hypothetical protein
LLLALQAGVALLNPAVGIDAKARVSPGVKEVHSLLGDLLATEEDLEELLAEKVFERREV